MVLFLRETAWWKAESRRNLLNQNKINYKFSADKLSGSGIGILTILTLRDARNWRAQE
jgi:hypothetical protein